MSSTSATEVSKEKTSATLKVKPLKGTLGSVIREAQQKNRLLVLEFTAQKSSECQQMKTVLEDVAGEAGNMTDFYEVDFDQNKSSAGRLGVLENQTLPIVLVVKNKFVVDRVDGVVAKTALLDRINKYKVK